MNIFVFDIETVPDVATGRHLYQLDALNDYETAEAMLEKRREKKPQAEFMPLYLQRIVAISIVFRTQKTVKVWSLGDEQTDEPELIKRFFAGIEKYTPQLVSWNGTGFDLPVLHYRSLLHGINAANYWDSGERDQNFKWNNYLNRFHQRHLDLMDVLSGYQARAYAPLDEIASMLGFPGKMGMSGAKVWDYFLSGDLKLIRDYCETDVLNTYLVFLRFELMRGNLSHANYEDEIALLKTSLQAENKTYLNDFLNQL